MLIDLYEDQSGGLHLHKEKDNQVHDLVVWEPGGFQSDVEALDNGTFVVQATTSITALIRHPYDASETASWQHVATWYGPGVFVVYPTPYEIGRNAERYIGSYLIHVGEYSL